MSHPIRNTAEKQLLVSALRRLQHAFDARPPLRSTLNEAWSQFADTFGDPRNDEIQILIDQSNVLTAAEKRALWEAYLNSDVASRSNSIWNDINNPISNHQASDIWSNSDYRDYGAIRTALKSLDVVLALLSPHNAVVNVQQTVAVANPPPEFVLARDGEMWLVRAFGVEGRFSNLAGFPVLVKLLRSPGKPVPMLELLADKAVPIHSAVTDENALDAGLSTGVARPESVLDMQGEGVIRKELERLTQEIKEAENDVEREELQTEFRELFEQLNAMRGMNGKSRTINSDIDRMRVRISNQLDRVRKKLREANPALSKLADHLESPTIQADGVHFIYLPPPKIVWKFFMNSDS